MCGWFESSSRYQIRACSSEEEHSLDKRKADISKLSKRTSNYLDTLILVTLRIGLEFAQHTTQETTMSNKSPFEIRLEILKMTAELMKSEYESNMEFITEMQDNLADKGLNTQAMIEKFMPKPFSFDEMLAKSKQFYEFVNAK